MNQLTFAEKLIAIQTEIVVPKSQRNTFGNYNYRSCEDILGALNPLLKKYNLLIKLSDSVELIGTRYYVKATASLSSGVDAFATCAYARESEIKKGMDEAQITGSASSYARKYALSGLLGLDDQKDSDIINGKDSEKKPPSPGEFVCAFGSLKGKRIKDIPMKTLIEFLNKLEGPDVTITPPIKTFIGHAETYIKGGK